MTLSARATGWLIFASSMRPAVRLRMMIARVFFSIYMGELPCCCGLAAFACGTAELVAGPPDTSAGGGLEKLVEVERGHVGKAAAGFVVAERGQVAAGLVDDVDDGIDAADDLAGDHEVVAGAA